MRKARFWRSTFGLVVLVAMGFAAATVLIGFIAIDVTHEALEQQLDHRVAVETQALIAEAHQDGFSGLVGAIRRREAARSTSSLDYLLIDAQGRRMAGGMSPLIPIELGYEEFFRYRRDDRTGVAQSLTTAVPGGKLVVAADRAGLNEIDRTLVALFSGALIAMLVVGTGSAVLVGWLTRQRLSRIDSTAHAIIGGDFDRRVPRDGSGSEFDNLAATLNRMLDRISGLMDNLRQVSSDVAHDLRTPLTRLYNRLERAMEATDQARADEIEAARGDAGELLDIFAALLRIAEIEGMSERLPRSEFDLSALMEQMAETYRPDAEASDHHLLTEIAPGVRIVGDRRLISQAIANLLDNGLRHTPVGTTISISTASIGNEAMIGVFDDGPGVEGVDANRLFQRFARLEHSRSSPGHGLGLALVSAVVAAHGGKATINNDRGFRVTISLPKVS